MKRLLPFSLLLAGVAFGGAARAEEIRFHGALGAGHAVGGTQQSEFGFGGKGQIHAELPLAPAIGVELGVGAVGLLSGSSPSTPNVAPQSTGFAGLGTLGVRLRPMGAKKVAGLWVDASGGLAASGGLMRLAFDINAGYDFRVGKGRFDVGPFVGYTQILQPNDTLRPDDAHLLWVGVHVALGAREKVAAAKVDVKDKDGDGILDKDDACPDVAGVKTDDPKTNGCPKEDKDGDGILDKEDACPDVPGIKTDDPKTNGCPGDRDKDEIADDVDACPDVPGIKTNDPKTNGCPPDRDHDGVTDKDDACPDVAGVKTDDPKTNGCPASDTQVHMEGDRIEMTEVILFDLDSPRVRHVSFPLVKSVAEFILNNPDITEVTIQGHADSTGTESHNMRLSRERAESVGRLLVKFGVPQEHIRAEGFGQSQLRVQTQHAERQNRRVQFFVTRTRRSAVGGGN